MSLTRIALKIAAPVPKIENYQRYLFIGPHPDDIEIGAGATAAKLAAAGKEVCFLICIDGRFGDGHAPEGVRGQKLIEKREAEARASAVMLGVNDVRFLGLCDGGFYEQKELIRGIAQVVSAFSPEVIFAPDPCVTSECHIDHLNVGNAARQIACFAPYSGIMACYQGMEDGKDMVTAGDVQEISPDTKCTGSASDRAAKRVAVSGAPVQALAYYMTAKPNRFVKTSGYLQKQLDSIFGCHSSQFPEGCLDAKSIGLYLKLRAVDHGIRSLKGCAEGFRVLGVTHMHCLPEAGL